MTGLSHEGGDPDITKAVILIGGPQKGTRFRPLSLDVPKPLFPVAGIPLIQHLIESCVQVPSVKEILILGYFSSDEITPFIGEIRPLYPQVRIRYLQEYTRLDTAGGIYHFRDQIKAGNPSSFIIINGDVGGDFPLQEMLAFHSNLKTSGKTPLLTILATEATRQQSVNYGCIVENKETHSVTHYVEKPETFVSATINCGVYVCSLDIFPIISKIYATRQQLFYDGKIEENGETWESIALERDIIMPLTADGNLYVYHSNRMWSQVKTAGSAIYANRQYLAMYKRRQPERLAGYNTGKGEGSPRILGDVYIHPSAQVHPSCLIGPNVSIGKNVTIGPGVRIRESIILGDTVIQDHTLIRYTIVGWNSYIGKWTRVEGTPCDPNPNKPFAKMENVPLFHEDGKLNPSITILGCHVRVPSEVVVLNSIVLPYKELSRSFSNEIIL
ncbi:Mannose-1-phosphate guanyltransferase alpha-B [Orchesella cincta]|uniref:Mannose-1-phosphate guanyltransferase alpha-B n=1 Tax=Orchesella cincta TaxID=48709 RepID=A0A1D2NCR7_ORCCI|nr:Mannose-1-phosphate guanyltransferase alpha-B [Orchesella cincta]